MHNDKNEKTHNKHIKPLTEIKWKQNIQININKKNVW